MRIYLVVVLAALMSACNQNNDFVTESGIEVSCLVKGEGSKPQKDSIIVLYMSIVTENDKVLLETNPMQPMALAYDPEMEAGHVQEVLNNLEEGDSVYFETTAENLFTETYKQPLPPDMTAETKILVKMKFAEQMSREAYQAFSMKIQEEQQKNELAVMDEKLIADGDSIDAYLAEKNIEAQTSESGLRYVITAEGSGQSPEPGDMVAVHYTGTLLTGEVFDSSVERGEPIEFPIGQGNVIPGWDEGISYLKKGGKATFYIPSPLAYGARARSAQIAPYTILLFDVELVDVKKQNAEE